MRTKINRLSVPLLWMAIMMVFTISSCKKDTLVTTPASTGPYNSINDFYLQKGTQTQTFTIDPTILNTLTGNQGTVLSIAANKLFDSAGNPPSGNVLIQLKEVYTKQNMVLTNMATTSSGQILKYAGGFYINFVANGIQYHPQKMQVDVPHASSSAGIQVYYGSVHNITGEVTWIDHTPPGVTNDNFGYHFTLPNTVPYNWVSCAFSTNVLPQTSITVSTQVQQGGMTSETVILNLFLVFKTANSAMGAYTPIAPGTYVFNNVPEGKDIAVVGIGVGKLTKNSYFARLNTTVITSQSLSLTLVKMPAEQIKTELQNL